MRATFQTPLIQVRVWNQTQEVQILFTSFPKKGEGRDSIQLPEEKGILLQKEEVILVNGPNANTKRGINIEDKTRETGRETVQKAGTGMIPNKGTGRKTGQEVPEWPPENLQGTLEILQGTKQGLNS